MYHCTIVITFKVQQKMLAQYIRKKRLLLKKEMLDTVDITPEHLEEIFLCFTGQGSCLCASLFWRHISNSSLQE